MSVAAAGFLVFIIVLAIVKYIIFVILFIGTRGKLKFWIFPNLTEDVGFFESFVPAYVYTYDKPKKAKDSDDEESSEEEDDDEDEKGKLNDINLLTLIYLLFQKTEAEKEMGREARLAKMTKRTVMTTVRAVTGLKILNLSLKSKSQCKCFILLYDDVHTNKIIFYFNILNEKHQLLTQECHKFSKVKLVVRCTHKK